jgi:hypothetical protein
MVRVGQKRRHSQATQNTSVGSSSQANNSQKGQFLADYD